MDEQEFEARLDALVKGRTSPVRDALAAGESAPAEWRSWTVGYGIKRMRIQFGLNQKALAHRAGLPASVVCRAERDRDVRLSTIRKIYAALGCAPVILPAGALKTLEDRWRRIDAEWLRSDLKAITDRILGRDS